MLLKFARSFEGKSKCATCESLSCAGWESIPGGFITNTLESIGTLRVEDAPENWENITPREPICGPRMLQSLYLFTPITSLMSMNVEIVDVSTCVTQNVVDIM